MPISLELRASARAAYRELFRAAATTFKGDGSVLNAFRERVRAEYRAGSVQTDAEQYAGRVKFAREVADVLKHNIVQGVRVSKTDRGAETSLSADSNAANAKDNADVWRLRITDQTELGSNATVKLAKRCPSGQPTMTCCGGNNGTTSGTLGGSSASVSNAASRTKSISRASKILSRPNNQLATGNDVAPSLLHGPGRGVDASGEVRPCHEKETPDNGRVEDGLGPQQSGPEPEPVGESTPELEPATSTSETESSRSPRPQKQLNYPALKRAHQNRVKPELNEHDIEETFVRGSGPGGQSINKTRNNVQLLHKPTGIRVNCQETRSLAQNRKIARKILVEKLDQLMNPGLSKEQLRRAKQAERERRKRKKAKKKTLVQATTKDEDSE